MGRWGHIGATTEPNSTDNTGQWRLLNIAVQQSFSTGIALVALLGAALPIGRAAAQVQAEWRAYAAQKAAAGTNAAKLLIGVPGAKTDWQGNTVAEHMDWIVHDTSVGVAIWDAQFEAPYWKTGAAWKNLVRIKTGQ